MPYRARIKWWKNSMSHGWIESDEWRDWYALTPNERWRESLRLREFYLAAGGSLDPEPDTQSPFYFAGARSPMPANGGAGVRLLRRSGV